MKALATIMNVLSPLAQPSQSVCGRRLESAALNMPAFMHGSLNHNRIFSGFASCCS